MFRLLVVYLKIYLIVLAYLTVRISSQNNETIGQDDKRPQEYLLNPEKLDMLLHTAAVITLMKSKAKALLSRLPHADAIVYEDCEASAENAVEHARCVVHLLKARDAQRSDHILKATTKLETRWHQPSNDAADIIAQVREWIAPFVGGSQGSNESEYFDYRSDNKAKTLLRDNKVKNELNTESIKTKWPTNLYDKYKMTKIVRYMEPTYNFSVSYSTKELQNRLKNVKNNGKQSQDSVLPEREYTTRQREVHDTPEALQIKKRRRRQQQKTSLLFMESSKQGKFKNIEKLQRFYDYFKMFEYCQHYMKTMGDSNAQFLGEFGLGYRFEAQRNAAEVLANELQDKLKNFTFENFPILSPKLFSVFPEEKPTNDGKFRPTLLSPNMFSLHEEGVLSLPTIFKLLLQDEDEVLGWLDLFIEISGAEKTLDKLDAQIQPKIRDLRDRVYPMVLRLEDFERRWNILKRSLNGAQEASLRDYGYAILHPAQKVFLHSTTSPESRADLLRRHKRGRAIAQTKPKEDMLESDIYKIAALHDNLASYSSVNITADITDEILRNVTTAATNISNAPEIGLLRPFLYSNKLRQAPMLNNVVLSPKAFTSSMLSPRFLAGSTLSPSAFTSSILSPSAMTAIILSPTAFTASVLSPPSLVGDILSPKFFHANVLAPRALAALVLSPRTMLVNVLSPRMIEFRVLSPTTFYVGVLTPSIILPRVLSPNNFVVSVLSPSILSPHVLSKGNFTVQILSPAILSGSLDATTPKPNAGGTRIW